MLGGARLPHALLFAGPDGVGKKAFALELARALMCKTPVEGEACGKCPICRRIGVFELPKSDKGDDYKRVFLGDHPDVGIVIPFKRNLLVGAIRELEREANFRPFESEIRVFIVDDADKMNDSASNALLKTLEEPPSTTFLILVTSRPDSLLPTIRSRCQVIRFAPVPVGEIEKYLIGSGSMSPEDARVAARVSDGSVSRAMNTNIGQFRAERDLMLGVLRSAIETGETAEMLKTSEQLSDGKNKDRFEESFGIMQKLISDLLGIKSGKAEIINVDITAELTKLADNANISALSVWMFEIEEILAGLNSNLNRRAAVDSFFVRMASV